MKETEQELLLLDLEKFERAWGLDLVNKGEGYLVFHFELGKLIPFVFVVFYKEPMGKKVIIPPYMKRTFKEFEKQITKLFLDVLKIDNDFEFFIGKYDLEKLSPDEKIQLDLGCKVREFNETHGRTIISPFDFKYVFEILPAGCLLNGEHDPLIYPEEIIAKFAEEHPTRKLCEHCWYRAECDEKIKKINEG